MRGFSFIVLSPSELFSVGDMIARNCEQNKEHHHTVRIRIFENALRQSAEHQVKEERTDLHILIELHVFCIPHGANDGKEVRGDAKQTDIQPEFHDLVVRTGGCHKKLLPVQ